MDARSRCKAGSRMEPEVNQPRPALSDEQWARIADLFANPKPSPKGGRPRADARSCLEGVLWVLRTGARWKDLPCSFPSYATCWRRFVEWTSDGVLEQALRRLGRQLDRRGRIAWEEGFADGTFAPAKKGATTSGSPVAAREPSSWSRPTAPACRWRSRSPRPILPKSI